MTTTNIRSLRRGVTAAAMAGVLATTACSAGLDSLPLPAPSVGAHTYTITAEFANALNLPTKAKVKLEGADVGDVEDMHARDFTAVVSLRIRSGVRLPVGTNAELRSATPMGDVFVALTPPAAAGSAVLHDGSVIPESSTSDAATIEAVLSRAALLVNGGAVRDLAKVVNGLGADLDGRGNRLAELISQTTTLVRTLSQRSDQIRAAIRDTGTLTDTIAAQQSTVNAAVAAAEPAVRAVGSNTQNIVDLAARLSRIAGELEKFPSVNGTGKRSLITDMNNLSAGLNAAANLPRIDLNVLNASIGIVGGKVASSAGAVADADIAKIAVGPVPDPNFPGNEYARIPDQTDWANFVGSLAYTLQRLHDRVIGPGR
ncbi:MCE family protein [Nocardia miyunensis]|uniref:MCE family protein n=1 Tax=Nocardia miyunensis TaxID=282684 RepID=UPI00082F98E9|nr:MCE family protein [Nocardia miyunensis]